MVAVKVYILTLFALCAFSTPVLAGELTLTEVTKQKAAAKPLTEVGSPAHSEDLKEGMRLLDADKPSEALPLFKKYLVTSPKSAQALLLEATALSSMQKDADASVIFKQAIVAFQESGKESELAHAGLGSCLLSMNRIDDAIHQFQVANGLSPDSGVIDLLLARAYLAKRNPYYAQLALRKIEHAESLKFSPDYLPFFKARAFELTGRTEDARNCLEEVKSHLGTADEEKKNQLTLVIDHLQKPKEPGSGPISPERRHYNLSSSPLFTPVHFDRAKRLITVAFANGKDPDQGRQDGENDGYVTMPQAEFDLQTRLKDGLYVVKE